MCWSVHTHFTASPVAPEQARDFVVGQLEVAHVASDEDTLWDVRVVMSELVTNAVDAGSDDVSVALSVHRGELRIEVSDRAPGWPVVASPPSDNSHGRGLMLVTALSSAWGVLRQDGAKQVWALLPLTAESTTAVTCSRT